MTLQALPVPNPQAGVPPPRAESAAQTAGTEGQFGGLLAKLSAAQASSTADFPPAGLDAPVGLDAPAEATSRAATPRGNAGKAWTCPVAPPVPCLSPTSALAAAPAPIKLVRPAQARATGVAAASRANPATAGSVGDITVSATVSADAAPSAIATSLADAASPQAGARLSGKYEPRLGPPLATAPPADTPIPPVGAAAITAEPAPVAGARAGVTAGLPSRRTTDAAGRADLAGRRDHSPLTATNAGQPMAAQRGQDCTSLAGDRPAAASTVTSAPVAAQAPQDMTASSGPTPGDPGPAAGEVQALTSGPHADASRPLLPPPTRSTAVGGDDRAAARPGAPAASVQAGEALGPEPGPADGLGDSARVAGDGPPKPLRSEQVATISPPVTRAAPPSLPADAATEGGAQGPPGPGPGAHPPVAQGVHSLADQPSQADGPVATPLGRADIEGRGHAPAPTHALDAIAVGASGSAGTAAAPPAPDPSAIAEPQPPAPPVGLAAQVVMAPHAATTSHGREGMQSAVGAAQQTSTAERAAPAAQAAPVLLSMASRGGSASLNLQLRPNELGHMQVRIARDAAGAASVSITVERPDTLALLQRDQATLHRALDQAGVPTQNRALSLHLAAPDTGPPAAPATAASGGGEHQGGQRQSSGDAAGSGDPGNQRRETSRGTGASARAAAVAEASTPGARVSRTRAAATAAIDIMA